MSNDKRRSILILKFPFSSTYGGGEKHTLQLVEKLTDYQFYLLSTCSVLIPEFKKRGWETATTWAGTEPVTLKAVLLFFFTAPVIAFNLIWKLLDYKFTKNVDTIFCLSLTEKLLLTPWARIFGMRVIWMEHLQIENWLLRNPFRWLYILWSRLATVVTVAEAVRDQLVQLGVPKNNCTVIYNAINVNEFLPHPSTPEEVQTQFKILFVGRLAQEKGIDDLLRAIHIIRIDIPTVHLTIVGQGDMQPQLEQLVQDLHISDQVTFAGFQTDVRSWMEHNHVLVLPAIRRETFGIVLIEAMATDTPVIATRIGGLPEVVGRYGWLVDPRAPNQIAEALHEIYHDYAAAIVKTQHGRVHVLELFREDKMLHEYDQLFASF